ncbi:MAG: pyrroline-5-carboxylate reductase [Dehalococcoidia bacterium]
MVKRANKLKLAFIGGGIMGEAMIGGVMRNGLTSADAIIASDPDAQRRAWLQEKYHVTSTGDNREALSRADVVVLAIKPQNIPEVSKELKGLLSSEQLVLSIAAGVKMATLSQGLNHDTLVRAMPNTPGRIGQGITVWTATQKTSELQRERARSILTALGEEVYVEDEKYLDMATALSASGPGFIAMIIESLIEGGISIGLPREMTRRLVLKTIVGSCYLLQELEKHPAELRDMVTSPGGTTTEGVLVLEEKGVRAALIQAIRATYEKARVLGSE